MEAHFEQVFEAIFIEAFYCDYRKKALLHSTHPVPRGPEALAKIHRVVNELVRGSEIYRRQMEAEVVEDELHVGRIKVVSS